ncbi:ZIP family metal transporter [Paenibacillus hunanensis]|uniref:ZIP family metal transporter n=1 Tax=Paenibacillus hunanensis TaxID=539262 RepID=UPI002026C470|nr:ZIP family metal transporter [Paenibacillus hunanensis]MCL9662366.1 ZIP family metal transporter [Paenibacillus hunanensis]
MWGALMWGAIAGSAVLLGAVVAAFFKIPKKIIGWIMAFGTGTLIGAASFELLEDAIEDGGLAATAIGFLVGAVVYTIFDLYVSSKGGANRKRSYVIKQEISPTSKEGTAQQEDQQASTQDSKANKQGKDGKSQSGLGIFAGTVMDAIPESIMIGASLLTGQGVSAVLVVSIFVSNIPEGLSSTVGMQQSGFSRRKIFWMWLAVLTISALASMLGYLFLEMLPKELKAGIGAFAGGGIIAMLCSTMAPEAYEEGGPIVGLIASMGLLAALVLSI